jgi:hypothetical protein
MIAMRTFRLVGLGLAVALVTASCGSAPSSGSDAEVLIETTVSPDTNPATAGPIEQGSATIPDVEGGDESAAGSPINVLGLLGHGFIVSISDIRALHQVNRIHPTDDRELLLKPWEISVTDVLWETPLEQLPHVAPRAGDVIRAFETPTVEAFGLGAAAVSDAQLESGSVVVGLMVEPAPLLVFEDKFLLTFVAVEDESGVWTFPGLPENARADDVMALLMEMMDASDSLTAVDRYVSEAARASRENDWRVIEKVQNERDRLFLDDEEIAEAPTWEELAPTERMLNLEQSPDHVLKSVRAAGIEFVYDDPNLTIDPSIADYISVRARLGVVTSFATSIGSQTLLVLREPGETLEIYMGGYDGTRERLIGEIPPFDDASVAIVRIGSDGAGGVTAKFDSVRTPTDTELQLAASFGVLPDGTIDLTTVAERASATVTDE